MSFLFGLLTNLIKQVNTSLFKLNKENRIIAIIPSPQDLHSRRRAEHSEAEAGQLREVCTCILAYLHTCTSCALVTCPPGRRGAGQEGRRRRGGGAQATGGPALTPSPPLPHPPKKYKKSIAF